MKTIDRVQTKPLGYKTKPCNVFEDKQTSFSNKKAKRRKASKIAKQSRKINR